MRRGDKRKMQIESKALAPFQLKAYDDDEMTFEGLASTWDIDLGNDKILPGAFTRTLNHWRESKKALPLIDMHEYGTVRAVVGKLLEAEETEEGLYTKWQVINSQDGQEIYARLKGNFVDGLSIGYRVIGEAPVIDGVRNIRELQLKEVSVVIWGMNPQALVQSVKSAIHALGEEEREHIRVLLQGPPAAPKADAQEAKLAPTDPERLALEACYRDVLLRSLAPLAGTDWALN
jgi:HK97 family phage prohead protease